MSKTNYLLSSDTLHISSVINANKVCVLNEESDANFAFLIRNGVKTISQGALGAMTFGAYHQYTTNKIMELDNETQNLQQKYFIEKMENQHKKEMEELKEKLNSIEQKRWWY